VLKKVEKSKIKEIKDQGILESLTVADEIGSHILSKFGEHL